MDVRDDASLEDDFREVGLGITAEFKAAGPPSSPTERIMSESSSAASVDEDGEDEDELEEDDELEDDDDLDEDDELEDDDMEDDEDDVDDENVELEDDADPDDDEDEDEDEDELEDDDDDAVVAGLSDAAKQTRGK